MKINNGEAIVKNKIRLPLDAITINALAVLFFFRNIFADKILAARLTVNRGFLC